MARAGMAKWRQGGGGGRAPSSLTEGGDEVQRSLELLDRVLSEFDDLENGNVEERGGGVPKAHPQPQQQQPSADLQPAAAPPPAAPPCNRPGAAAAAAGGGVGGGRGGGGGGGKVVGGGGGSTPEEEEEEEEEEERSHQSEDDGYMSMNGRRFAQRPPPPPPREEEEEAEGGEEEEEGGTMAETPPPPIPPLPAAVVAPRSPPLPPLPPAASAMQPTANEEEDFPPPPEEAERIISTLLPRVSPSGGSGRARNSGRGRLACGWGSLGPPVGSHKVGTGIDPELGPGGCLVTTATQTTLPQTRHQRPYGWNAPVQGSIIPAATEAKKPRRGPGEGKPPPPLPPLRFGSLPLDSRPLLPAPLPPRTLPGAGERHRVVRRRDEGRVLLVTAPDRHQAAALQHHHGEEGSSDGGSRRSPAVGGEEETFSDDSLEATEAAPRPPPSPSYSASSTSPPGSEDGKRRSVAWEVSLEELDALAEEEGEDAGEEGGGEGGLGSGEVASMLPGCTRVVRGRSSRSRRSSSSDRSLASSEPRSVDDRSGSWRGRRSTSSASVGLHLSSNGEEEFSGSGLEGGGEAAAELDEMANAEMAILGDVDVPVTSQEVRGGPKGTYVIRKRKGRAGIAKGKEDEAKVHRGDDATAPHLPPLGTPPSETSWTSSPDSDEKRNPKNSGNRTPEKQANRTPKLFHNSRIPIFENSRIPIPDSSRILVFDGSKARTPERSSPSKNVVYLSGNSPKTPEKTPAVEPHQVVVKITDSGSATVVTGDQDHPATSLAASFPRPNELPELRKTSRPNTPLDKTPERRNTSGKLPPAPPPRTVTAHSPAAAKPPMVSPTTPEVAGRTSSANSSNVPESPVRGLPTESSSALPEISEGTSGSKSNTPGSPVSKISTGPDRLPVTPESKLSSVEIGPPEASSTPIPVQNGEKKEGRALKSPAPLPPVPRKQPAPQAPPRPLPRVLSMPAIAINAFLEGSEGGGEMERGRGGGQREKGGERTDKVEGGKEERAEDVEKEEKNLEVEERKEEEKEQKIEVAMEKEENRVEKNLELENREEGEKRAVEEATIKEEASKEVAMVAELKEKKMEEGGRESVGEEEKGERDGREREVETKEQVTVVTNGGLVGNGGLEEEEFGCFLGDAISFLPLQRSSTMPAVEESSPQATPIVPSASASSFPPLPPSPVDEYSEVYDTIFFMRKLPQVPRIPPPDGPLPPSPPPDTPPPPPPPHSMAFHRPREASLKSRSMDGGFPRGQRRAGSNGRRGGGEVPGERRTLPTELQGASGRRRRTGEGDRPLSPVPSPPPHAPAHLPPPRPQIPAPPTASLPETPVFSPRKGAPAADVPRRGHMYARRGESNGEACSMRHPSGAMTAGPGSGVCSGYSLCGTVVSSTSSTASSSPFPGGLGPGRGWYPRHRHHGGVPPASSGHHHHLHPAHNRPRPASTEHLDRLASGPAPTSWDLHGYGPARTVVGGGTAVGGICPGGVGARKPLTLPPNLTPKFFHRSPREALRRVTSLLIRKGSTSKEAGRRDGGAGTSGVTSPTAAGPSSPPAVPSASGESPEGSRGKRGGFFKNFWKRSRHYSLEHQ